MKSTAKLASSQINSLKKTITYQKSPTLAGKQLDGHQLRSRTWCTRCFPARRQGDGARRSVNDAWLV